MSDTPNLQSPIPNPPAIPRGVADFFGAAAVAKRQVEFSLREQARLWGYVEVIPPTFEYAETLAAEAGSELAEEFYRFLDRDGRALALRPDLTIPTARMVGSKLYDQPLPQRYFYAGPAFRYEEPRAGRQREFWQAGIELVGAGSSEADAEVLAFAVTALAPLGLNVVRFTLGHLGYFHGLVRHLDLDAVNVRTLHSALDRKSYDDLARFASAQALSSKDAEALMGLLALDVQPAAPALERAAAWVQNEEMAVALDRLRDVQVRLTYYGAAENLAIDLADVRGMDYYTGITFKAYTPEMGFSIVNGGRYDNLVGHFGPAMPAVGCAFYLDRILLARQRQSGLEPEPSIDLLVRPCACGGYVELAAAARATGKVVAVALGPESANVDIPVLSCSCESGNQ
ncbi:MAG: ATP phosphoribosyltransferase regulatory subunit [Caldilineales bacterium]|nr:ATP phosphoribosyltransferase regulatory subunit [Caldilineales bacterium]